MPVLSKDDTDLVRMDVSDTIEGKVSYLRMGTSYNDKSKHFYDNYYSIYGQLVETLENILFTQQTIEKRGIPYRMLTIANWLTTDVSFDMIKNIDVIEGDLIRQRTSTLKIEELLTTFQSFGIYYKNLLIQLIGLSLCGQLILKSVSLEMELQNS